MYILSKIKLELLAINSIKNTPKLLGTMPVLLNELEDDLTGSGITTVNIPIISKSYKVSYNPNFDASLDNPNLNFIVLSGDNGSHIKAGFGDDILLGGNGNDILEGGNLIGGAVAIGTNILWGGNGNDQLFGTTANLTFIIPNAGGALLPFSFSEGSQYLYGGSGDDFLVAFVKDVYTEFGNASITLDITAAPRFLSGGDGNDTMYGECETTVAYWTDVNVASPLGGLAVSPLALVTYDGGDGNDFMAQFSYANQNYTNCTGGYVLTTANCKLLGGAGDDTLIGSSSASREISLHGGSFAFKELYGDSILDGGKGNDLLIGDDLALSITIDGGNTGGVEVQFGNDTLIGGSGNDQLIGDVQWFGWHYDHEGQDQLGALILDGSGNPYLVAGNMDSANVHGGNNILFGGAGNDTLTGGNLNGPASPFLGQNKFLYDGLIKNGNDTITDFNIALDTLVGQRGATFHDGGHNGDGDLVVKVWDAAGHNSSTITLQGVHDNFADIHILSKAVVIV